jgi:hypothetical protein
MLTTVHFQELSSLNSPLLQHPSVYSLRSVVDSLLIELSPLPTTDLSSFTRSTVSTSVLQNLLAHVVAAEAEADTSDDERRYTVEDDWSYGPDEAGELFYNGDPSIGRDTIAAAKGLVDLHETDDSCTALTSFC